MDLIIKEKRYFYLKEIEKEVLGIDASAKINVLRDFWIEYCDLLEEVKKLKKQLKRKREED